MTGELFEINENRLRVVSLDGHRISIRNIELKESYSPLKVVVPGKTLQEISKILTGEAEDMVDIFFADNHILFEFDETKVVSRLIEKEGKDLLIGFNPKFFIDALRVIDDEEVTLYMVNPKAPCFIKDDAGTYVYLILPVNFNAATV